MPTPFDVLPSPPADSGLRLLRDVTVIDLTTSVAGPYATQLLADMGADVIKIEKKPSGDDSRAWGPPFLRGDSLWYLSVNRNKHSVLLDINCDEGREVLHGLLAKADVLVVNVGARVQQKLGIDFTQLSKKYPRLIHVSVTGFGLLGDRADLPCYDLIAEGYSGVMDMTGEPDSGPQKIGTPAADLLAGQDAAMAALAALYARQHTGCGQQIDVSMVRTMTRFMAPRIVPFLGSGDAVRRAGGRDSVIAIYQVFDTADQPITLGLGNNAIWARFWNAVGDSGFGANPSYGTNEERRGHREEIVDKIAAILRDKGRDHWLALFAKERIPAGPINRLDEVVQDPYLLEEGLFYAADTDCGRVPQVGLGIAFDGKLAVHRMPPPTLGQHTESVLQTRLGIEPARIDALRAAGVI